LCDEFTKVQQFVQYLGPGLKHEVHFFVFQRVEGRRVVGLFFFT
jgi:hypothetical protein